MSEQKYDNNNSGVLFKNEDKREGKRDADYRGQAEVDGVHYWLSAWVNESKKDGRKYLSLRLTPKDEKATRKPADNAAPAQAAADFDDDIPF